MKKFRVEETVEEKDILDEWSCDLCGTDLLEEKFHPYLEGESLRGWEQNTDIMRIVEAPDESSMAILDVDLCSSCWDNKLIPWLRENGFNAKYHKSWEHTEHEENCEDCKEERKKNIN